MMFQCRFLLQIQQITDFTIFVGRTRGASGHGKIISLISNLRFEQLNLKKKIFQLNKEIESLPQTDFKFLYLCNPGNTNRKFC